MKHRYAVVAKDHYSDWVPSYPTKIKTAQETMNSLQKFVPPGQKPGIFHTDYSQEFIRACEDLLESRQRSAKHGNYRTRSPKSKRRDFGTSRSVRPFRKVVGKSDGMPLFFTETYKTNWQTESHRVKEDLELYVMVQ